MLIDRRLPVVALQRPLTDRLDKPRVGVGRVDRARRQPRRAVGLDRARRHPARAVPGHPAPAPGLVGRVSLALDHKLLRQPARRLHKPAWRASAHRAAPPARAARRAHGAPPQPGRRRWTRVTNRAGSSSTATPSRSSAARCPRQLIDACLAALFDLSHDDRLLGRVNRRGQITTSACGQAAVAAQPPQPQRDSTLGSRQLLTRRVEPCLSMCSSHGLTTW